MNEFRGVHGLGCFAVGAQFVDVLFDRREVGGVGAVEAAAGALETDGAGAACGFDVAGFGAAAVGDGDGAQFVGGVGAGAGSAVVVDDVGGELGDGVAFSFQGDGVVALGGADGLVVHQFAQDVEGVPASA